MKITREVKLGLIMAITLFLFIWGLTYLKGKDIFSRQLSVYAVYENVSGLVESNPVVLSGVKIGQVDQIYFHPDGSGRIMVKMIMKMEINIPNNSVARLTGADFMGFREIEILLGNSGIPVINGDTLPSLISASVIEEVGQQMLPLKHQAENLLAQADSVLAVIQYIFDAETRDNITRSFDGIRQTIVNLEETTATIDSTFSQQASRLAVIVANAESISTNLRQNNEAITNIIQNFSEISDTLAALELAKTMEDVNKTMEAFSETMEKINRGEGSVGLLVNDEELYRNLEQSSKQLDLLLEDIRENPRRYINVSVFGRN
ncbi:MAG: MCE family protein [Bacteroidales bacterium]|nr:MCE family protein [Bacteroidales bacterium]